MPFLSLLCVQLAFGALLSLVSAAELRASTRAAWRLRAAQMLYTREVLASVPALAALWSVQGDWLLGYRASAQSLPPLVSLAGLLLPSVLAIAGFVLGARWVRGHRVAWGAGLAAGALLFALVLAVLWRARWAAMTSTVQFRGAFGPEPGWTGGALAGVLGWVFFWGLSAFLLAVAARGIESEQSDDAATP